MFAHPKLLCLQQLKSRIDFAAGLIKDYFKSTLQLKDKFFHIHRGVYIHIYP
jgi:hypothetical protein